MSEENIELLRDAFRAFTRAGIDAALSFFPPDFVWYPTDRWLEESAYRGHEGMRRLAAAFSDNFDRWGYEGGLVVSNFHGDTLGEVRAFPSWSGALKAVGLLE